MRKAILGHVKALGITALFAGIALISLPAAGCAQQGDGVRLTGEKEPGAEVTYAADERPTALSGSVRRIMVTKHGPRRR